THSKNVLNRETQVVNWNLYFGAGWLVEQRAKPDALGPFGLEVLGEEGARQTRVNDVFDDQHVLAFDGLRQVLGNLDNTRRFGAVAVASNAEELDAKRQVDGTSQIRCEHKAALEDGKQNQ